MKKLMSIVFSLLLVCMLLPTTAFASDECEHVSTPTVDTWDGTSDTSWYNEESTKFVLDSAEDLAGLATLVNNGTESFEGKTVKLDVNINLAAKDAEGNAICFVPIGGLDKEAAFQGTFDGDNHIISDMYQSGWSLGYEYGQRAGLGLFGWVYGSTIKNLHIDNSEIVMEAVVMGNVAGYAGGDCTFENIKVTNSIIANYNWDTGGIVGQAYGGEQTYTNMSVDNSNLISALWGTWDASLGGIIGRTSGVEVTLENCDVAAVMDAYNDVVAAYQWYAYRYSGMLVGYTKTSEVNEEGTTVATAPHVTCINCTVTYGDWANYTYCQFTNVYPQFVREQGGYATDPYYSGRHWTEAVDVNGNKVVDSNHAHADNEDHSILLPFNQLFGGSTGTYGTNTHEGVTVKYDTETTYTCDVETLAGTASLTAKAGDTVKIEAVEDSCCQFKEWVVLAGDVVLADSTNEKTSFTMPEGYVKVVAVYEPNVVYDINVVNGSSNVTSSIKGETVTITAAEKEGYVFTGWRIRRGNAVLADEKAATTTFTMPKEEVEIEAVYEAVGPATGDTTNVAGLLIMLLASTYVITRKRTC